MFLQLLILSPLCDDVDIHFTSLNINFCRHYNRIIPRVSPFHLTYHIKVHHSWFWWCCLELTTPPLTREHARSWTGNPRVNGATWYPVSWCWLCRITDVRLEVSSELYCCLGIDHNLNIGVLSRSLLYFPCRYFSLQATNPLGFGDSVRMEIESNICREGGPLPDCFTTPLRQAWTTMEKVRISNDHTPWAIIFNMGLLFSFTM